LVTFPNFHVFWSLKLGPEGHALRILPFFTGFVWAADETRQTWTL
jgi:hypothetical protein